jgi:CelD/BcsL family acetyltransferase involved in cellulose biosynthesis
MIREVVRWAIEQRFESVDLQLGGDPYKLRWSSSTYDTVGVLAACPSRLAASRAYLAGVDRAFRLRSTVRSKVTKQRG